MVTNSELATASGAGSPRLRVAEERVADMLSVAP
jgi:hypothetical protein